MIEWKFPFPFINQLHQCEIQEKGGTSRVKGFLGSDSFQIFQDCSKMILSIAFCSPEAGDRLKRVPRNRGSERHLRCFAMFSFVSIYKASFG